MPKRRRWILISVAVVCAALCLALGARIAVPILKRASDAGDSLDDCMVRNQLLIEALDYVGVCDERSAAAVWAEGLRLRSAAMQMSVMDSDLRTAYIAQLGETFPNWVTGVSSPWVDSYDIQVTPVSDTRAKVEIKLTTATSTGIYGTNFATLTVEREGAFWRISDIDADEELDVYTGFLPE